MPRKRKIRRRLPTINLRRLESMHRARIKIIIDPLRAVIEKELFPSIETFVSESKARTDDENKIREDDTSDIISSIFGKIRVSFAARHSKALTERELKRSADRIAQAGGDVHRAQLKTVLGVDPISAEPWLETEVNAFVKENASLITTLHTEQIDKIEQLIFREGRRRASVRDIHLKIRDVFKQSEARAALIARDQVSKFNGKLTELRQRNAGITKYKWQTAQDGRVRTLSNSSGYSDHGNLNDQEFSWDKPPITVFKGKRAGERNHPGEDINCRCIALPVLDELIPGLPPRVIGQSEI